MPDKKVHATKSLPSTGRSGLSAPPDNTYMSIDEKSRTPATVYAAPEPVSTSFESRSIGKGCSHIIGGWLEGKKSLKAMFVCIIHTYIKSFLYCLQ